MGSNYYYTTYADSSGSFSFENVRTGTYGLRAWSNGGSIGDVSSELIVNDITVQKDTNTDTKSLPWKIPSRTKIFQIGELDRKSLGFQYGGSPYTHGLVAKCPAYLTYTIGSSKTSDWCFGQSSLGTWTIKFSVPSILSGSQAILTVSLAGWSTGSTISIHANNQTAIGNLSSIASDPSLYRSGTTAGEWHLFEFPIGNGTLRAGANTIAFTVDKSTLWRGAMWDSVLLELQKA